VLRETVTLLELALELIAATVDDIEIVVGEFAPLLLHIALELLPVAFNAIPIHCAFSCCAEKTLRMNGRAGSCSAPVNAQQPLLPAGGGREESIRCSHWPARGP